MCREIIMRIMITAMMITWPGLSVIFDLYSSKYLVNPPMPEGRWILSCAIPLIDACLFI